MSAGEVFVCEVGDGGFGFEFSGVDPNGDVEVFVEGEVVLDVACFAGSSRSSYVDPLGRRR